MMVFCLYNLQIASRIVTFDITSFQHCFFIQINGSEKPLCRELHIAYRYGDHYDSVRHIGDNSESPSHLRIEVAMQYLASCY